LFYSIFWINNVDASVLIFTGGKCHVLLGFLEHWILSEMFYFNLTKKKQHVRFSASEYQIWGIEYVLKQQKKKKTFSWNILQ
jgi:hypothetical protein